MTIICLRQFKNKIFKVFLHPVVGDMSKKLGPQFSNFAKWSSKFRILSIFFFFANI